jgi:NADPH:quinone reductase|tara:strand:- start:48 stop:1658 length:1611 start_codon:yes stop_codon:yes gene_type:complete
MVRVCASTIIAAPIDTVWRLLRDFNGHDQWHTSVASSAIEAPESADSIGAVRRFKLADGKEMREQLLALSDVDYSFRYCLLTSPIPLDGYVAMVRLKPVTDVNQTFWEWRCEFQPPPGRATELTTLVHVGIYQAGFDAVRRLLTGAAVSAGSGREPAGHNEQGLGVSAPISKSGGLAPGSLFVFEPNAVNDQKPRISRDKSQTRQSTTVSPRHTRAIVIDAYGGPEVLRLREITLPPPEVGEVQIRHTAIGVNYIDVYCRSGYFDLLKPPGTPGMEAAGVIEAIGAEVEGLKLGDRVAYACPPVGAYCERRNMSPDLLVLLSPTVSDEYAAAGLLKGVSASFLLHEVAPLRPGSTVLVHAAAGGVGQLLVQWARHLGATVIATASNDDKLNIVQRLGAHHCINYSRENFAERVKLLTHGHGVDTVFDAVGAETFSGSVESLAVRGHLVSFGQASGPIGARDIGSLASKSVTLTRPNYGHYTDTAERLGVHAKRFFNALQSGLLHLETPRSYSLADAAQAHRDLEGRRSTGSMLLIP